MHLNCSFGPLGLTIIRADAERGGTFMLDAILIAGGLAFFVLSIAYVRGCDLL